MTYGELTGPHRVDRDSSELLSTNIILSTATIKGIRPAQPPPLARTIDPDALETAFGCFEDVIPSPSYAGYRVTLDAFGSIEAVLIGDSQSLQ